MFSLILELLQETRGHLTSVRLLQTKKFQHWHQWKSPASQCSTFWTGLGPAVCVTVVLVMVVSVIVVVLIVVEVVIPVAVQAMYAGACLKGW
mmetsp:Transcript_61415/g.127321  ORF Transcript_61415/g.127321 Transcript_61415/m.127321 type:complete len:92 (+) Transcript_61415:114-389(+)